jgi:hypothetical protein
VSAEPLSENFYRNLTPITDFPALADLSQYTGVPSDWSIILTDIRGSTRAIRDGRYKDVNTLGAAAIAVAKRVLGDLEFPFVFGGDGATLLVPERHEESVLASLAGLRDLAKVNFGMDLRLASIRISELEKVGAGVQVAKFAVSETCIIAELRGEGLRLAEEQFKQPDSHIEYRGRSISDPDLRGLSCRWTPFRTRNGVILTVIIEARSGAGHEPSATFGRLIRKIESMFPGGMASANPGLGELQGYRATGILLREESRLQKDGFSFAGLVRIFEILVAGFLFNHRVPVPVLRRYVRDTPAHCDFRKFDSSFRAVLDCNPEQLSALESLLKQEHESGAIFYGTCQSDQALMTCLVEGLNPGEHLHFIDGSDGGYAIAAERMKLQKKISITSRT